MKTLFVKIMLLPISLLAACSSKSQQAIDFIPGTYVNHAQSAYSVADDTLQIIPDVMTENSYHVIRKTAFRRILNGKLQPEEHQMKSFNGLWDEQKQILQLMQNGIILVFQPDSNKMVIQNSPYRRL
jgi:hypothetical protein